MNRMWARDPLAHFLIGGVLLFLLFAWRGEEADPATRNIEISREQQAVLATQFERTLGRPPTDAELAGLVDRRVREEVLYREALRLGLDRDDPVVRRRLAAKMNELASAKAETEQPSGKTLRAWLAEHPERFTSDMRLSFDQLYFSDRNNARAALSLLREGADWRRLGEAISVPASQQVISRRHAAERYGRQFAASLEELEPDAGWQGPVPSGFGWHLVRLRQRDVGGVPPFEDIRQRVEADWRNSTMAVRREKAYELLREAYSIDIEE